MSTPDRPDPADDSVLKGDAPALAPWAIVRAGRDGAIRGWSPAAEELFGLPAAEAIGRHYLELADPAFRGQVGAAFGAVLTGRPAGPEVVVVARANGTSVVTLWTAVPMRDAAGAVSGVLATGVRLPRLALGESRRVAERFWRGVFDANPLASVVLDADDRVIGANPRFMSGVCLTGFPTIDAAMNTGHCGSRRRGPRGVAPDTPLGPRASAPA